MRRDLETRITKYNYVYLIARDGQSSQPIGYGDILNSGSR